MAVSLALIVAAPAGAASRPARSSAHVGQPARPSAAVRAASLTSVVWGGQVAQNGGGFTATSAWWSVPNVSCNKGENGTTYTWLGLGGWAGKQALEQIGTAQWCRNGAVNYGMFGEFYSSPPFAGDNTPYQPDRYPIRPGDRIYAEVDQYNSTGTYELYEYNQTRNWTFDTYGKSPNYNASSDPGNATAEVVMENPYGNTAGYDNPYYNSVVFDQVSYSSHSTYGTALINNVLNRGQVESTTAGTNSVTASWQRY